MRFISIATSLDRPDRIEPFYGEKYSKMYEEQLLSYKEDFLFGNIFRYEHPKRDHFTHFNRFYPNIDEI